MHTIETVRTEPHRRQPLHHANDVYIRTQGAEEARYQDAAGRTWSRAESGELCALMSPGEEPAVGDVIELRPWQG